MEIILRVKAVQILDTKEEIDSYSIPDSQTEKNTGYRANLEIIRNLKGSFKEGESISINSTFSNCEIKYQVDKEYILFIRQKNNEFFIETCSYSEPILNNRKSKRFYKKIVRKLKNKN
ncbi:MAG: hypothetical protein KDC44_23285 [Phaeodactylibacter sp.]|nr:hypothetical protein [Phaeodactylibacter sp.]